jgi:alkanesulfonate monooxygenase SsuD/methylene tetrahydromethanopterin reductase-like flavin-dependent oxidoreductase (luciferase family)
MRKAAAGPHAGLMSLATVDKAIEAGIMFAGTPDQVYRQIARFHDHIGGFGHLLLMGQAGFLEHEETAVGIRTFAREVYPRLRDRFTDEARSGEPAAVA